MKAILIEFNGDHHEVEIPDAETAGVVLRQDTRLEPSLRAFRFKEQMTFALVPIFKEVSVVFIDRVPGELG